MEKITYEISNLRIFGRAAGMSDDAIHILAVILGKAQACKISLDKESISSWLPSWRLPRLEQALKQLRGTDLAYRDPVSDQCFFSMDNFSQLYDVIFLQYVDTEQALQSLCMRERHEVLSIYCTLVLWGFGATNWRHPFYEQDTLPYKLDTTIIDAIRVIIGEYKVEDVIVAIDNYAYELWSHARDDTSIDWDDTSIDIDLLDFLTAEDDDGHLEWRWLLLASAVSSAIRSGESRRKVFPPYLSDETQDDDECGEPY